MIYFDNAATTWPKPRSVIDEIYNCLKYDGANPGRSGHKMAIAASEKIYSIREIISDFFGVSNPSDVIFTSNATHALNIVIRSLLSKGGHVICTSMDHNSVLRCVNSFRGRVEITMLPADSGGYVDVSQIAKYIRSDTALVVMSHVSNVCGSIQNMRKASQISHEFGIPFLLDASQSAGLIDIDMTKEKIDYLAFPGHKALYGPMGTGVLCINSNIIPDPIMYGGTGSNSQDLNQPEELPERLESGTLNFPGICGLGAGISFVKSLGLPYIKSHEMKLVKYFLDEISDIKDYRIIGSKDITDRNAVISIVHSSLPSTALSEYLNSEYNIACRAMYHCAYPSHVSLGTQDDGSLRISLGVFNTIGEIKTLLYALEHFIR